MNRNTACLAAFVCALGFAGRANAADPAPRIQDTLTTAPEHPYDETADAKAAVALALTRAEATHKYVLIDLGGNWCPDCRVTAGVLAMKDVQPWVDKNFIVVLVDVGRMNKNLDIAKTYDLNIHAVPTIIILDDKGKMLNSGNPTALKDARGLSPQAIVDTLNGWIQNPG